MRVSLPTLQRLNPGADAFMRRVIDSLDQADFENELEDAMEQPSRTPSQPVAQIVADGPSASHHAPGSDTETEDEVDDDRSAKDVKCFKFCETHPLPILQKTVPLPLNGIGSIKYRKNLAYGKVLFARFIRNADFSYPLKGYFFIRADAEAGTFFRMYGEINKESNVGDFVIPRDVVQTIEAKLRMKPKQMITIAAAAAGIDPGSGYKFKVPSGYFALLITKA